MTTDVRDAHDDVDGDELALDDVDRVADAVADGVRAGVFDACADVDIDALALDDTDTLADAAADGEKTGVCDARADVDDDALADRVDAHDTFSAETDAVAEYVGVGATGGAHESRDASHDWPAAHRAPPSSDVHDGPASTVDGHHDVADDVPHDSGDTTVEGPRPASANVKTACGAHAAALTPTHAIRDGDHVLSAAHTVEK